MKRTEVRYATILQFAKRIERMNLQKTGRSLSWNSMTNYVRIYAQSHDSDIVEVDENWKDQFKQFLK